MGKITPWALVSQNIRQTNFPKIASYFVSKVWVLVDTECDIEVDICIIKISHQKGMI
jgi:hypothetical protein